VSRDLCWISGGIASVIAAKFWLKEHPDALLVTCDTGSEDEDNARFLGECEGWLGRELIRLKNPDFEDTHAVYRKRRYMSGIAGAPCTMELKVTPRLAYQEPGDVHVFGYTADEADRRRFGAFGQNYPELTARAPLIDRDISKANCLALIQDAGIAPPRTYAMGFPCANCLKRGCVKATSPDYWSLFRQVFPERFAETAALARDIGARLARVNDERVFIDEIPADWPTTNPIAPACDFLCHINGQDLAA
jgi:hypothetical protein